MNFKDFSVPKVSGRIFYQYAYYPWPVKRKQFKAAIAFYNRGLEKNPKNAAFHRCKGWFYHRDGKYSMARACYSKAIKLAPKDPLGYMWRGYLNAEMSHPKKAFSDYNKGLECDPENAMLYSYRGQAYRDIGSIPSALKDFGKAVELDPTFISTYAERGWVHFFNKDFDAAIADFNSILKLSPSNIEALAGLSCAYSESGLHAKALEVINRAIELMPTSAELYNHRGWLNSDRFPTKAGMDFKKAVELAPYNSCILNNYALMLKSKATAIKLLTKAISDDHHEVGFFINRAYLYLEIGEINKAIEDYSWAITLKGGALAYSGRAIAKAMLGKCEAALADFNSAFKDVELADYLLCNRGLVHATKGNYATAIVDYTAAIGVNPNCASAYKQRGAVYFDKGKYRLAKIDAAKARELGKVKAVAPVWD